MDKNSDFLDLDWNEKNGLTIKSTKLDCNPDWTIQQSNLAIPWLGAGLHSFESKALFLSRFYKEILYISHWLICLSFVTFDNYAFKNSSKPTYKG